MRFSLLSTAGAVHTWQAEVQFLASTAQSSVDSIANSQLLYTK